MALRLLAQTPRAGRWNHRLLVAPQHGFSETEVLEYLARASAEPIGKDYIAVSRDVRQASSGREGREMLVLVGVASTSLSPEQHQKLSRLLNEMLERLADLVTEQIDWDREGKRLLVERDELERWVQKVALPDEQLFKTKWQRFVGYLKVAVKWMQQKA